MGKCRVLSAFTGYQLEVCYRVVERKQSVNFIGERCLFDVLVSYYLRGHIDVNLAYSSMLLSYISHLESRKKLPPGKEKSGLRLTALRCDDEWVFSQIIDACKAFFYS